MSEAGDVLGRLSKEDRDSNMSVNEITVDLGDIITGSSNDFDEMLFGVR